MAGVTLHFIRRAVPSRCHACTLHEMGLSRFLFIPCSLDSHVTDDVKAAAGNVFLVFDPLLCITFSSPAHPKWIPGGWFMRSRIICFPLVWILHGWNVFLKFRVIWIKVDLICLKSNRVVVSKREYVCGYAFVYYRYYQHKDQGR